VGSIVVLNLTNFSRTEEFVFLHFIFFLLSWVLAYLMHLIEEGVGVDGYMQVRCRGVGVGDVFFVFSLPLISFLNFSFFFLFFLST
jgi:hypothetical protein